MSDISLGFMLGHWVADTSYEETQIRNATCRECFATVRLTPSQKFEEYEANVRLILRAPDMFHALFRILRGYDYENDIEKAPKYILENAKIIREILEDIDPSLKHSKNSVNLDTLAELVEVMRTAQKKMKNASDAGTLAKTFSDCEASEVAVDKMLRKIRQEAQS